MRDSSPHPMPIPNPAHLSWNTNSEHGTANTEHGTHYTVDTQSAERSCPTLASLGLAQLEGGAVLVPDETTPYGEKAEGS